MPEFFFQRYVDGERMADDVLITKRATLEDAIPAALRLCRNSPKSVLVHILQTPWRDIESAPKDGTKFLAWFTWPGRHSVEMARWQDNRFAKQPKPYWTCDNERVHGIIATRAAQPTHWMPLPEPPR